MHPTLAFPALGEKLFGALFVRLIGIPHAASLNCAGLFLFSFFQCVPDAAHQDPPVVACEPSNSGTYPSNRPIKAFCLSMSNAGSETPTVLSPPETAPHRQLMVLLGLRLLARHVLSRILRPQNVKVKQQSAHGAHAKLLALNPQSRLQWHVRDRAGGTACPVNRLIERQIAEHRPVELRGSTGRWPCSCLVRSSGRCRSSAGRGG